MACSASDDYLKHTVAFVVYEADLLTNPGRWRRASDLGGHALFIDQHSSKSLPARDYSGYHEDCIYFMCDYNCSANPLHDSGVYNIRDDTITIDVRVCSSTATSC
jgi:tryptophanase